MVSRRTSRQYKFVLLRKLEYSLLKISLATLVAIAIAIALAFASTTSFSQPKPKYMVDSIAFFQVTEVQKTPVWCWAASIAMTIRAQGVKWRQEDVVLATKGQLSVETASEVEMTAFLNRWNMLDYDGRKWSVQSRKYNGFPPTSAIKASLESGRPMIFTYRTGSNSEHAVVLYSANYPDDGSRLHSVYFYDPYTGEKGEASGSDFRKYTTNAWDVQVTKQ